MHNSFDKKFVITIDGPAASGKSSVSRELAGRLGCKWVSTGAFYRGLAFVAHKLRLPLTDESGLTLLATDQMWAVELHADRTIVVFNGADVTDEITKEEIGNLASQISQYPTVRSALLDAQRNLTKTNSGLVAEGRDCGTVVFPQAQVKFYLTARAEDRAARRALEEGRSVDETIDAQKIRDQQDASRKTAPMLAPEGAIVIDTTGLGFVEVVNQVENHVRNRLKSL